VLCRDQHLIREALEELGLRSYPKTSGADGIHVLVPIARRSSYKDTYELAERVSRGLEADNPGLVTTEWLKKKRQGVLVDHRQNGHGKTIASAYSVRPKPGAPVSTPLRWEELGEKVRHLKSSGLAEGVSTRLLVYAGQLIRQGVTSVGGALPVNPGGGLLSRGHPVGATGVAQIVELTTQLRGKAGARQRTGATIALAECSGGQIGADSATAAVTILAV